MGKWRRKSRQVLEYSSLFQYTPSVAIETSNTQQQPEAKASGEPVKSK